MKNFLVGLVILGAGNVIAQEAPSFKHVGIPFLPANFDITWSAPTNQQPRTLWVYKTIPQNFSDAAVSNLMALGSFTKRDIRKLSNEERAVDKNGLAFVTEDERRSLGISPTLGFIFYQDQKADDATRPVEDVPNDATAKELALKLLDQIGIPRSELATKQNSSEPLIFREIGTRDHFDKKQGKRVKEVYSRSVFFIRQIHGVNFAGIGVAGGFYVQFTSDAKVAELNLVWRNFQPYKKYRVASPDQIIQWVKEGKAVMPAPNVNPSEVRKLTITQFSPLYMGALGDEPQDFTYPFANLNAVADMGQTNINVEIYCPILSTNAFN